MFLHFFFSFFFFRFIRKTFLHVYMFAVFTKSHDNIVLLLETILTFPRFTSISVSFKCSASQTGILLRNRCKEISCRTSSRWCPIYSCWGTQKGRYYIILLLPPSICQSDTINIIQYNISHTGNTRNHSIAAVRVSYNIILFSDIPFLHDIRKIYTDPYGLFGL